MAKGTESDDASSVETTVNYEGRLTIPAQIRRAAGISPGQALLVSVERGRVVIEERAHLLARLQEEAIAAAESAGRTGGAVDELIAERRAEAMREEGRA